MTANEVILQIGGEGGSAALYGMRVNAGWLFSLDFIELDSALTSEQLPVGGSNIAESWPDAISLLDRYPWHNLQPLMVHPEFRSAVLNELKTRCEKLNCGEPRYGEKWTALCAQSAVSAADEELAKYQTKTAVHASDTWLYGTAEEEASQNEEEFDYLRTELMALGLDEDEAISLLTGKKE